MLSDSEIQAAMSSNWLVKNGDPARLNGASYEVRLGSTYYDLTESDRPILIPSGGTALIKPGHRVVLITLEELNLPDDTVARVVTKGSLFSVGLSPVATYADPGFVGNLGLVMQNLGTSYIELPIGEPIAKVEFSKVSGSVLRPYQGQHGFQTGVWPIKYQLQKTYDQVKGDPRVQSEKSEAYKLLPAAVSKVLKQIEFRQRLIDIGLVILITTNGVVLTFVSTGVIDATIGVATNLISSVITALAVWFARRK